MANYYRVSPKFWPWARRRGLTDAQTELALYLLTCEHRNLEGLYRLPKLYISADLNWAPKKVDENLAAVLATGFALYDEDAEMLLIPKALKHQAPTTEKQIAGAIAQIERIPRSCLWDAFRMACESHCPRLAEAIEVRWPRDTDAIGVSRVHAASSSISSSTSNPPQPPEQARGEQPSQDQASPVRVNPRARGTNPRAVAKRTEAARAEQMAVAAVGALTEASDEDRETWGRLQAVMRGAVGDESSAWTLYVEPLSLAGVIDGELVIDGPAAAWGWHRAPKLVSQCAGHIGARARMATRVEHEGLERVAA